MANIKDLATSLVATAPSPAASGTSLVVTAGQGSRFPAATFYATIHPDGTLPTLDNAEIVAVTAVATDTFTITRAQRGTTAQSIAVGWRISNAIYTEDVRPPGEVTLYGGSSAPGGWLLCDGTAVSRTTYDALFTAIGTSYGVGDGSTTFNLPNLQASFPVGYKSGDSNFGTLGGTGGSVSHSHTLSSNGSAQITEESNALIMNRSGPGFTPSRKATVSSDVGYTTGTSTSAGLQGNTDSQTAIPPYQAFNFIIKT